MNFFSKKSSIFLLAVLGMVILLSMFAKSTIGEYYTEAITQDTKPPPSCDGSVSWVKGTAIYNKCMAEVTSWAKGDWYKDCTIDFKNTKYKDILTAKCKDLKGIDHPKIKSYYNDCKKYSDANGNVKLINNNGKLECDRKYR